VLGHQKARLLWLAMVGLGLSLLPGAAQAQFGGDHVEGAIVDIRGDILQVRPRFSMKLTRVIVDDKTEIQSPQIMAINKLQPGVNVFGFGDYDAKGGITPRFLMVSEERRGFFAGKIRGVRGTGYGKSAMFGGKLKSVKPFVVTDDDGKEITATIQGFVPVMHNAKADRTALQVGKMIEASGERTADGLLHARAIDIQQGFGGGPGGAGAVFGEVVAVNGNSLEVMPRFGAETIQAKLKEGATLLRQITVDPDTVKVGDTITVQGKRLEGPPDTNAVAFVLLVGKQTYPQVSPQGFFAAFRGAGNGNVTATGKVASLSPFVLTLEDGKSLTVVIPGQTPVVDLRPLTLAEIKPGDKLMLIGSESKDGGMVTTTLVVGASPIVGFGN